MQIKGAGTVVQMGKQSLGNRQALATRGNDSGSDLAGRLGALPQQAEAIAMLPAHVGAAAAAKGSDFQVFCAPCQGMTALS